MRLAEERPDNRVMPARFVDGEAADMIELSLKAVAAFGKRTVAKRRFTTFRTWYASWPGAKD